MVGHLVREKKGDPAKETLCYEMERKSKWWRQMLKDFKIKKMTVEEAQKLALDKPAWRSRSSSCLLEPSRKKISLRLVDSQLVDPARAK